MKNHYIFCLSVLMAASLGSYAQEETTTQDDDTKVVHVRKARKVEPTRTITGRVVAHQGQEPLSGVLVQSIAGQGYSVLTAEDGTFTMQVPMYSSAVSVTIPGYNTVRVGLTKDGILGDITMQSDASRMAFQADDNIKNDITTGNMEFTPALTISDEIGNQLNANVRTITRGGISGLGNYMQIAGVNTLNSNAQPLIVVDDVIVDQQYMQSMLHQGFYNDMLLNINPNDIEEVKVLVNGTALYGAKGSNGVILIKTKRSRSLATRIDAVANFGVELMPQTYDVMNGAQYKTYAAELLQGTKTDINSFRFLRPQIVNGKPYTWYNKYANNTNWNDEVYRTAITQNYGISVQGGGDVAGYMLSLGYTRANSTLKGNDLSRLNIRFNTDIKISSKLNLQFDAAYTDQTRHLFDSGTPDGYDNKPVTSLNFLGSAKASMLSPYSYANGQVNTAHYDIEDEDYLDEVGSLSKSNYRLANPSAILNYGNAENKNYFDNGFLSLTVTPKFQINKHLYISEKFSYILANTNEKYYVPLSGVPDYYVSSAQKTYHNEMSSLFNKGQNMTSDTRIDWNNVYGAHSIHVMGGFRYVKLSYNSNAQGGYNSANDKTPSLGNVIDRWTRAVDQTRKTASWYAQAEYNYANRYYATFDVSMETNSEFGSHTKDGFRLAGVSWAAFPSIQAGWVVSNEKWFGLKGINYLKLTAGYGMSGNDDISYNARKTYLLSQLFSNRVAGVVIGNIGNSSLQWETVSRFNAGIDLRAVNNRLHFGFNYFHSWTDNLLTMQTLAFTQGVSRNWGNSGSLENQGFDASMQAHLISGTNWNWTAGVSMGHYINTLTSVPDVEGYIDTPVYGATVRSQVGRDINSFYGYKTNGIYSTTAQAQADGLYIEDETGAKQYFQAGDVRFVDIDGNGRIDDKDRTFIGCATPDIYGNITSSLSYKQFRLDVNFKYSLGGDIFNYARQQLESGSRFMNQTTAMLNRWTSEGDITEIPRATYGDPMGNSRFSDRWIEDASYLKLKNVTLSYKLPINNIYIQGLTVWLQANNLFTVSRYLGTDPETSFSNYVLYQGIDTGLLSQGRNFHLGVKINL